MNNDDMRNINEDPLPEKILFNKTKLKMLRARRRRRGG